jgi:hypothetical protein
VVVAQDLQNKRALLLGEEKGVTDGAKGAFDSVVGHAAENGKRSQDLGS